MIRFADISGHFQKNEDGGMTLLGLYMGAGALIVGGLAVDGAQLMSTRTQLQVAADFAAHAALYTREHKDAQEAKAKAIELTRGSFPSLAFGKLLTEDNIHFGTYDAASQVFTIDENQREAVYVQTERLSSNANPVTSFLMQFVGFKDWDVLTPSVFEVYRPHCLRDGWVGDDTVDSQSNNYFHEGFCIHSNTEVEINSGSIYESGVTVSAPDGYRDVIVPTSGYESNDGLYEAIDGHYYPLRIFTQLDAIYKGIYDVTGESEYSRPYLINLVAVPLLTRTLSASDFVPGFIYTAECSGNQQLQIDATPVVRDIMIDTNCKISFKEGSALENVVIWTTNTSDRSINSPNDLRLGKDDNCDPANGVNIVTYGGFEVAAGLEIYGSQVLAKGPIQFSAKSDGVQGGSFISLQTVDGTSNTSMGICANNGGEVFEVDLFRMAG